MCQSRFKRFLNVLLFAAIVPVYASAVAETEDHAQHRNDWPGIYYGFLPCDDCIGLKTSLALNKNNSYILITQYVGRSPRDFVEKGKFTWSDNHDSIVLTPRNGGAVHYYQIGENQLIQLDAKGQRIAGKEAERYILRRTDVTGESQSHGSH